MLPLNYFSSKIWAVLFITVNDLEAIVLRQIIKKLGQYLKHHGEESLKS